MPAKPALFVGNRQQSIMEHRSVIAQAWRRRWMWAAAAALACLALLHPALLEDVAGWLIAEEPVGDADCLVILGGDRCFAYAAQKHARREVERIVLLEGPPNRLVRLGVLPSRAEIGRRELEILGVDPAQVTTLAFSSTDEWAWVRRLQSWLKDHPDVSVVLLCDRFDSGSWRYVLDRTLPHKQRRRVAIRPLPDRRYNETNWWKSRTGIKAFASCVLDRLYAAAQGESRPATPEWDPDAYEYALK